MKKLLYSILALVGVVTTSCEQENIEVVYRPENVTAAQILDVKAGNIADGVKTEVIYTDVNYNMNVSNPIYTLYIAKSGTAMAGKEKLSADFANPTDNQDGSKSVTIDATTINNILTKKLKAEFGQEISVDFQIETSVSNEKGNAVAGSEVCSNIVTVSYTPVEIKAALPDAEEFDKVWVIGDYCGWNHGATQFLFDYTASGNVYSGVIDFGGKAANGFKLTGVAKWDDTCNWGLEDNTTAEAEASSLQLITGGGSQDIKSYSKRYYKFSFDKTSLILTKEFGFDSVGVVGVNGDWNNDIAMEFNPVYCRFYVDVTFVEGDKFKCRADGEWNLNWGATSFGLVGDNDGNFIAEAGNYRVYLNLNKGTFELNADMYGKQEPGVGGGTTPEPEPEPEPQPGIEADRWGIVGTINNWGEGTPDLYMNEVGENLYVRMGVTVTADDLFKVRFNNAWATNYGGPGDAELYAVTVGEEMALVANGKNLSAPAGTYDIYFNIVDFKMWVMPEGETPEGVEVKTLKIYGDVSATGWTACYAWIWDAAANYTGGNWPGEALSMEGDYYVWNVPASLMGATVNVIFSNGAGGDPNQTVDITNVVLNDDVVITLTENGNGTTKWNYTINGEAPVTPEPPTEIVYGLVGTINGWSAPDVKFEAIGDGGYKLLGQALTVSDEIKIRANEDWEDHAHNYGLEAAGTLTTNAANTLVCGSGSQNMKVAADDTYDFYFYPAESILYVMTEGTAPEVNPSPEPTDDVWGLMGTFVDNNWSSDVWFNAEGNYLVAKGVAFAQATSEFKVRKNQSWADPDCFGTVDGGTYNVGDAIQLGATANGSGNNVKVNVDTTKAYDVYFYLETLTLYVMTQGTVPEVTPAPEPTGDVWTIKGDVNNTQWNNGEVATTLVDGFYVAQNVTFQDSWNEGANFKVLKNGTWMGSTAGGTHNVGDAIAVSESGGNITMNVTLDTPYDIYIDGANNNVYVVEAGATPAI